MKTTKTILLLAIFLVVLTFSFNVFAETANETNNGLPLRTKFDFDGDGKADIAVYRPSTSYWYILRSSDASYQSIFWGLSTDQIVPADYDGDGKTDVAVLRGMQWYVLKSSDNSFLLLSGPGLSNRRYAFAVDFDGDAKDDRTFADHNSWQYHPSSSTGVIQINFPNPQFANTKPVTADYEGDGKADFAVFRQSDAAWYIRYSSNIPTTQLNFGTSEDIPVPADYDGDGKADIAVFRPSVGDWYWLNSSNGSFYGVHWGANGDTPVPADYDGDGKTDVGVFRPSDGTWYILQSTAGFKAVNWGLSTDIPIPNVYVR